MRVAWQRFLRLFVRPCCMRDVLTLFSQEKEYAGLWKKVACLITSRTLLSSVTLEANTL
jgi:hypothetical protein